MKKKTITENKNYSPAKLEMTNFDHSIDKGLSEELKEGKVVASYTGWNFHGSVYWNRKKKKFICEVWCYHCFEEEIEENTLEEIMETVSDKYGSD